MAKRKPINRSFLDNEKDTLTTTSETNLSSQRKPINTNFLGTPAFNPEGDGYDYETAKKYNLGPDSTGHYPSRVPETGLLLKGSNHPTFSETLAAEEKLGNKVFQKDGRYYSEAPKVETPEFKIGGNVLGIPQFQPQTETAVSDVTKTPSITEQNQVPFPEGKQRLEQAIADYQQQHPIETFVSRKQKIEENPEQMTQKEASDYYKNATDKSIGVKVFGEKVTPQKMMSLAYKFIPNFVKNFIDPVVKQAYPDQYKFLQAEKLRDKGGAEQLVDYGANMIGDLAGLFTFAGPIHQGYNTMGAIGSLAKSSPKIASALSSFLAGSTYRLLEEAPGVAGGKESIPSAAAKSVATGLTFVAFNLVGTKDWLKLQKELTPTIMPEGQTARNFVPKWNTVIDGTTFQVGYMKGKSFLAKSLGNWLIDTGAVTGISDVSNRVAQAVDQSEKNDTPLAAELQNQFKNVNLSELGVQFAINALFTGGTPRNYGKMEYNPVEAETQKIETDRKVLESQKPENSQLGIIPQAPEPPAGPRTYPRPPAPRLSNILGAPSEAPSPTLEIPAVQNYLDQKRIEQERESKQIRRDDSNRYTELSRQFKHARRKGKIVDVAEFKKLGKNFQDPEIKQKFIDLLGEMEASNKNISDRANVTLENVAHKLFGKNNLEDLNEQQQRKVFNEYNSLKKQGTNKFYKKEIYKPFLKGVSNASTIRSDQGIPKETTSGLAIGQDKNRSSQNLQQQTGKQETSGNEELRGEKGSHESQVGNVAPEADASIQNQTINAKPSEAQKEAGNYKMAHIQKDGFDISIENPKGTIRSGTDKDGETWNITMNNSYGYIKGTVGKDKDHLDVFLNDKSYKENVPVFIVNQTTPDGKFDEHKVMMGFDSKDAAEKAYKSNYNKGAANYSNIVEMSQDEFKNWSKDQNLTKKPAPENLGVKKEDIEAEDEKKLQDLEDKYNKEYSNSPISAEVDKLSTFAQEMHDKATNAKIKTLANDIFNVVNGIQEEFYRKIQDGEDITEADFKGVKNLVEGIIEDATQKVKDQKKSVLEFDEKTPPTEKPKSKLELRIEDFEKKGDNWFNKATGQQVMKLSTIKKLNSLETPAAPKKPEVKKETKKQAAKVAPPELSKQLQVYDIPLTQIKADTKNLQNRKTEFSEESVQKIVKAVEEGAFNIEEFDPILLWKNIEGEYLILSGHSRTEAYRRLAKKGIKEFEKIPAKLIEAKTLSEAQEIAKRSNVLGTRETPIERAQLYRQKRLDGMSKAKLEAEADRFEGKGAGKKILMLSYLNPDGSTIQTYSDMFGSASADFNVIDRIANYIGDIRSRFPQLTDQHEEELYRWLFDDGAISNYANKVNFIKQVESFINHKSFDPTKPLGVRKEKVVRSSETIKLDEELNRLRKERADLEKKRKDFESGKELLPLGLTPKDYLAEFSKKISDIDAKILAATEDRRKSAEVDREQDDLFSQVSQEAGSEKANELIENSDPAELEKLASDIESKAAVKESLTDQEIESEIKKADDLFGKSEPASNKEITDFGEKIGGARKDFAALMNNAYTYDVAGVPLSTSFPEPNYLKLLEDGTDPKIVAWVRTMRELIPNKPNKSWKVKGWVKQVEMLRDVANSLINGSIPFEKFESGISLEPTLRKLKDVVELYLMYGHDTSLKGIRVDNRFYTRYGEEVGSEEHPIERWHIYRDGKNNKFGHLRPTLVTAKTKAEAFKEFKDILEKANDKTNTKTKFVMYSYKKDPATIWIGKKLGRNWIDLKSFPSREMAKDFLKNNIDELQDILDKKTFIPSERKAINEVRVGKDWRGKTNVTPEMFNDAFGFRGVEFGNWVNASGERQTALNNAYDALMDLADIAGIPSRALSLNGELGLAFGSRGSGGKHAPSAHYEADRIVINLTRKSGAGSLAHEWFHALDNYFSRMAGAKHGYLTEKGFRPGTTEVRTEVLKAFVDYVKAINDTDLPKRSLQTDKRRSKPYWTQTLEMAARSFENVVIEKLRQKGYTNDYLANIETHKDYLDQLAQTVFSDESIDDMYPYLVESEIPKVVKAAENLFNTLKTVKTDKGLKLYEPKVKYADQAERIKTFQSYGAEIQNGKVTLYHGTDAKFKPENLRYNSYLSSSPGQHDVTGNGGAATYGKYVHKYELPLDQVEVTGAGEFLFKGNPPKGKGLYPDKLYKAYQDYYGASFTKGEMDAEDPARFRMIASMGLSGGADEFDSIMAKENGELYGDRTPLQKLHDQKRHLELSLDELERIKELSPEARKNYPPKYLRDVNTLGRKSEILKELKSVNTQIRNLANKNEVRKLTGQFDIFSGEDKGPEQGSLFEPSATYNDLSVNEKKSFEDQLGFNFTEKNSKVYSGQDGEKIRYTSKKGNFTTNPSYRSLLPGEYSKIERKYRAYKNLKFFAKNEKITSPDDVAYIFRQLENESVEHAFVLHITRSGKPIVQHMHTGSFDQSLVDPRVILDSMSRFGTTDLYFVHNHPSGNIESSREDRMLLAHLQAAAKLGVKVHDGIIIDTHRNKYGLFFSSYDLPGGDIKGKDKIPLKAISFSRQSYNDVSWDPEDKITQPDQVAKYFTGLRFNGGRKFMVLSMTPGNRVVGRFYLNSNSMDSDVDRANLADEAGALMARSGGSKIIIVGNRSIGEGGEIDKELQNLTLRLKSQNTELVDFIGVHPSPRNSFEGWKSAVSSRVMEEKQEYAADAKKDIFFSKVESLVDQKAPNKGFTAQSILNMLQNNGAKKEELEWLDLENYLEEYPDVTKSELMQYIKANNVTIEETQKGPQQDEAVKKAEAEKERIVNESIEILNKDPEFIRLDNRVKALRKDEDSYTLMSQDEREKSLTNLLKHADAYLRFAMDNGFRPEKASPPNTPRAVNAYTDVHKWSSSPGLDEFPGKWIPAATSVYDEYLRGKTLEAEQQRNMYSDDKLKDQHVQLDKLKAIIKGTDTQYADYQLGGGENYRELLLKLPKGTINNVEFNWVKEKDSEIAELPNGATFTIDKDPSVGRINALKDYSEKVINIAEANGADLDEVRKALAFIIEEPIGTPERPTDDQWNTLHKAVGDKVDLNELHDINNDFPIEYYANEKDGNFGQKYSSLEQAKIAVERYYNRKYDKKDFISPHFSTQSNILAHVRFNDRYSSGGEKVLFLEEIQSDWHQEGRKVGYKKAKNAVLEKKIEKLVNERKAVEATLRAENGADWYKYINEDWENVQAKIDVLLKKNPEFSQEYYKDALSGKVPDAPFKKTWHELALKRMLRYAAENGYDRIAWTTGEIQSDRYNLSNYVDKVVVYKRGADIYRVTSERDHEIRTSDDYTADQLENVVGKDLAIKIVDDFENERYNFPARGANVYSGLDLKVGGTGMKGFYDQMIPNFLRKYTKKWGGTVEPISINDAGGYNIVENDTYYGHKFQIMQKGELANYDIEDENGETTLALAIFDTFEEAQSALQDLEMQAQFGYMDSKNFTVQSVPITPIMKTQVLQGQTLFEKQESYGTSEDKKLLLAVMRQFGRYPLNSPELGEYRNEALPTIQVWKRLAALGMKDVVKGFKDKLIHVSGGIDEDAQNMELIARLSLRELEQGNKSTPIISENTGVYGTPPDVIKKGAEIYQQLRDEFGANANFYSNWVRAMVQQFGPEIKKDLITKWSETKDYWEAMEKPFKQRFSPAKIDYVQSNLFQNIVDPIELPDETIWQLAQRKIQDKVNRSGQLVEIVRGKGGDVTDKNNFRLQAELYIGRAADKIEKLQDKISNKKTGLIRRLYDAGFSIDDFGEYLYAKHAPERNAEIKRKFQKENGSGIDNEQAKKILEKYKGTNIEVFEKEFRDIITKPMLKMAFDGGFLDEEAYSELKDFYDFYVPLKGVTKESPQYRITGKGYSVTSKGIFQARGRGSIPNNPFVQAITDFEDTIIRFEKNKIGQSLIDFIIANPGIETAKGKQLFEVKKQKFLPQYDRFGEVERMNKRYKLEDNELSVWIDGKQRIVTVHDPAMITGLKNLGTERSVKFLTEVNNYLRNVITIMNPEFMITNFQRDIQTALLNVQGESIKGMTKNIIMDVPKAMRGVWKQERGKAGNEWSRYFNEFTANGGKTGWIEYDTVDEKIKKFEKSIKDFQEQNKLEKVAEATIQFIEDMNEAVENGTRLAVYKNLREAGISAQRSASIAKNITVNFNKKGEWGTMMNTLWLFSNAGVQGSARIYQALKHKNVRRTVGGMIVLSFLLNMLNKWIDAEEYKKLNDYEKDSNWVLMLPNGNHLKVKLPYGFNFFAVLGNIGGDMFTGDIGIGKGLSRSFQAFVDGFNPFGSNGSINQLLSPTIFDPIVQIAENKNFFGGTIYPEQPSYQPKVAESQLYYRSVSPYSLAAARLLNKLTGGVEKTPLTDDEQAEYDRLLEIQEIGSALSQKDRKRFKELDQKFKNITSGWLDISPEIFDHVIDFVGGGLGRFIVNGITTAHRIIAGDPIPLNRVPVVRQIIGEPNNYADRQIVYQMLDESKRTIFSEKERKTFYKSLESIKNLGLIDDTQAQRVLSTFNKGQGIKEPEEKLFGKKKLEKVKFERAKIEKKTFE